MRILIANVQVPFVSGGAEALAVSLRAALAAAGHQAELVNLPFKWCPPARIPEHMLACRLFDLSEASGVKVDLLVGLRFPAYLLPHPHKVLWLLHNHRAAYDLWDHPLGDLRDQPEGATLRAVIHQADRNVLDESHAAFTISKTVSARLREHLGREAPPLYHPPPDAARFRGAGARDFLFFPSRLTPIKRQELVLDALALTREPVRVRLSGAPDLPSYSEELRSLAAAQHLSERVEWLGHLPDEELAALYARSLAVLFPPVLEHYGYITLEAMLSSKAVITCADSGGPTEFVRPGETGLVVEPTAEALAGAMDTRWRERNLARCMGAAGREYYEALGISWNQVVRQLCA